MKWSSRCMLWRLFLISTISWWTLMLYSLYNNYLAMKTQVLPPYTPTHTCICLWMFFGVSLISQFCWLSIIFIDILIILIFAIQWNSSIRANPFAELLWPLLRGVGINTEKVLVYVWSYQFHINILNNIHFQKGHLIDAQFSYSLCWISFYYLTIHLL